MKSNSFLRGVNVAPPEPTRAPAQPTSGEPSPPDLGAVMGRIAYHRDLRAIARRANELRDALAAFAKHTPESVTAELLAHGLSPADMATDRVRWLLLDVGSVVDDTRGFLWPLDIFICIAECNQGSPPDDGPEVRPDAIRTGKGGAR